MLTSTSDSRTRQVLLDGLTSGLHIGAQLYALIDGQPVADIALGHARLAADVPTRGIGVPPMSRPALTDAAAPTTDIPMRSDTLMLWLSAGKPITAAAILMLYERGLLAFDDPVAKFIPEFAQGSKESITIRHLLTHTAGIRATDTSYPFATWQETLARIYAMNLERHWIPGQKAGYHTHASWYILGELINRLTGQPHDQWIRQNIFLPLHMLDTHLSLTPTQYHQYADRIGYLYDTTVTPPKPLANYDTELAASRPRPSASCRGPIRELATFYEMLRQGGTLNGTTLLRPDTVAAMTARQRVGLYDITFRSTIDWGLGLILNSSHYAPPPPSPATIPYQFGPLASPSTFGHGGSQSSTGFCDPQRRLVVALLFNGCPGEAPHDHRLRTTLKALYEDLADNGA